MASDGSVSNCESDLDSESSSSSSGSDTSSDSSSSESESEDEKEDAMINNAEKVGEQCEYNKIFHDFQSCFFY